MPWHLSCVYGRADNSRNYIVWRFLYFIYSFLNDLGLELFQVCMCTELLNAQEFLQLNQVLHQSWNIHTQTCLIPPQPLLLEKTNRPSTTTSCPHSLHLHPTLGAPRAKVKVSSGDRQGPGYTLWKSPQLGTSWTCYTSKIVS